MARPTTEPPPYSAEWATDEGAVKIEPPAGMKAIGWAASDRPPAGWINWLSNVIGLWIDYLGECMEWLTGYEEEIVPIPISSFMTLMVDGAETWDVASEGIPMSIYLESSIQSAMILFPVDTSRMERLHYIYAEVTPSVGHLDPEDRMTMGFYEHSYGTGGVLVEIGSSVNDDGTNSLQWMTEAVDIEPDWSKQYYIVIIGSPDAVGDRISGIQIRANYWTAGANEYNKPE